MPQTLKKQIGGSHYKNMPIQPIEFATINSYDPCAFSILKYVSRHRRKNGSEDLDKAKHFIEIRSSLISKIDIHLGQSMISISDYCEKNHMEIEDKAILTNLHFWVKRIAGVPDSHAAKTIMDQITVLDATLYK